jgi:hypothetical protein
VYFSKRPADRGVVGRGGHCLTTRGHAATAAFGCLILGPSNQIEEMLRRMNPNRISSLPGCAATHRGQGRRKLTALPRCTAGHDLPSPEDRPPRGSSWADPAPAAPPDTTTVRARASIRATGSSIAGQADNLVRNDRVPGPIGRPLGSAGTAWRPLPLVTAVKRLARWVSGCLAQAGDILFASTDAEASWHAWEMKRRDAGLGRSYRDRRFDTLVSCSRCDDVSTTADRSVCGPCSAAERLIPV